MNLSNSEPSAPYLTWATAATNIQDAVDAASSGDTVLVTNGVYAAGGRVVSGSLTNRVVVDKPLTLLSVNGPEHTVIEGYTIPPFTSGDQGLRCVYLADGAVLSGFTLTNGGTRSWSETESPDPVLEGSGGGVWCESTNVRVSNCVIIQCLAEWYGGGSYSGMMYDCIIKDNWSYIHGGGTYGSILRDCQISGNAALSSGGGTYGGELDYCTITNNSSWALSIEDQEVGGGGCYESILYNCELLNNESDRNGGGSYLCVLYGCLLEDNWAWYSGGGTYDSELYVCRLIGNGCIEDGGGACDSKMIQGCLFVYNGASHGGGASGGEIHNSTFIGNGAEGCGGGVCVGSLNNCLLVNNYTIGSSDRGPGIGGGASQGTLTNCTLVGNLASEGGGVNRATLVNCIVVDNLAAVSGDNYDTSSTLEYCCTMPFPSVGIGNIDGDPKFLSASDGYYQLRFDSPCMNAGTNQSWMDGTVDLVGNPRVSDGTVDMGAYESSLAKWWLLVQSEFDVANPTAGVHSLDLGTLVDGSVSNSPVVVEDTNYVCTGWSGSGSLVSGSGTNVAFTLTNDSILTWHWYAQSPTPEHHFFEAEDGILTTPMMVSLDPLASGGEYVETPTDGQGLAEYSFDAAEGNYVIWTRCRAGVRTPNGQNSFYVSMDTDTNEIWDLFYEMDPNPTTNWTWDTVSLRGAGGTYNNNQQDPHVFELTSGTHILTFLGREAGTRLDRLLITSDLSYDPSQGTAWLTVQGWPAAIGSASPYPYGTNWSEENVLITNSVSSPVDLGGGVRAVCTGWTGVNTQPTGGPDPVAVFSVSFQATQVWHWATEYLLDTDLTTNGTVSPAGGWYPAGATVEVEAVPDPGYRFLKWTGPGTNNITVGDAFNSTVSLTMTEAVQLTATFEWTPAVVRLVDTTAAGASTAVVDVELVANGNENALGFSLEFDPALLTLQSAQLGADASDGSLLPNTTQAAGGRLGLALSLPSGQEFSAGTQQVVQVIFDVALSTSNTVSQITFGDQPTTREVVDSLARTLPAVYQDGLFSITPTTYEGDVAPRPVGNFVLTVGDWVQEGRFAAGLDSVMDEAEFQRADCAPRSTLGDGSLRVTDWVQAGRYAVGVDPMTPMGGSTGDGSSPTTANAGGAESSEEGAGARVLRFNAQNLHPGQHNTVSVELEALGDENALGFSVGFDPEILTFSSVAPGSATMEATLNSNPNGAASGRVGLVLALPYPTTFASGTQQVAVLDFYAAVVTNDQTTLCFTDQPVWREVSDPMANALSVGYTDAVVGIALLPTLTIEQIGDSVLISWSSDSRQFALQSTENLSDTNWSIVQEPAVTNGSYISVTVPIMNSQTLYRLKKD